jgi:hypothetical protein
MSMIGTDELNRAVFEDAEMARAFALRGRAAQEFMASQSAAGSGAYAARPSSFSHADAVSLPGVRMFPLTAASST